MFLMIFAQKYIELVSKVWFTEKYSTYDKKIVDI